MKMLGLFFLGALLGGCVSTDTHTYRAAMQAYTAQNFPAALDLLTPLAQNGYAPAQFHLGMMHGAGLGVPADAQRGGYFLQQAASQKHVGARAMLAKLYRQGTGVPRDLATAADWLESLAQDGYAPAQYQLAQCYEKAEGRKRDYPAAVHWYQTAGEQGYAKAVNRLAQAYGRGELGLTADKQQQLAWQQRLQHRVW